jgi:hypothetical protein
VPSAGGLHRTFDQARAIFGTNHRQGVDRSTEADVVE